MRCMSQYVANKNVFRFVRRVCSPLTEIKLLCNRNHTEKQQILSETTHTRKKCFVNWERHKALSEARLWRVPVKAERKRSLDPGSLDSQTRHPYRDNQCLNRLWDRTAHQRNEQMYSDIPRSQWNVLASLCKDHIWRHHHNLLMRAKAWERSRLTAAKLQSLVSWEVTGERQDNDSSSICT